MGRRSRSNVEHSSASKANAALDTAKNMPSGVNDALEKIKEMNEGESKSKSSSKPVKAELKDLVLFGKVVEEFSIGGYTFEVSTLSGKEQKFLVRKLLKLDSEERLMNVKEFTLAAAIKTINGVPLYEVYNDEEEGLSKEQKSIEVVSNFQSNLIERLFDKYEELVVKSNSVFEDGDLGEQVKN